MWIKFQSGICKTFIFLSYQSRGSAFDLAHTALWLWLSNQCQPQLFVSATIFVLRPYIYISNGNKVVDIDSRMPCIASLSDQPLPFFFFCSQMPWWWKLPCLIQESDNTVFSSSVFLPASAWGWGVKDRHSGVAGSKVLFIPDSSSMLEYERYVSMTNLYSRLTQMHAHSRDDAPIQIFQWKSHLELYIL